ncbi:unnamed protein product [Pleuronectes platessa]|uniref:Uncharacterized protein n=1 Tax=Pleuronectes platessa TaxID=8262 RepID=A0A9N7YH97_PLEPL|nr:unnamed protein product [Pleuronectes platessa]
MKERDINALNSRFISSSPLSPSSLLLCLMSSSGFLPLLSTAVWRADRSSERGRRERLRNGKSKLLAGDWSARVQLHNQQPVNQLDSQSTTLVCHLAEFGGLALSLRGGGAWGQHGVSINGQVDECSCDGGRDVKQTVRLTSSTTNTKQVDVVSSSSGHSPDFHSLVDWIVSAVCVLTLSLISVHQQDGYISRGRPSRYRPQISGDAGAVAFGPAELKMEEVRGRESEQRRRRARWKGTVEEVVQIKMEENEALTQGGVRKRGREAGRGKDGGEM